MLEHNENGHLNPVEEIDGKWYFWDETWSHTYGPYENDVRANEAMSEYCNTVLNSPPAWIEP